MAGLLVRLSISKLSRPYTREKWRRPFRGTFFATVKRDETPRDAAGQHEAGGAGQWEAPTAHRLKRGRRRSPLAAVHREDRRMAYAARESVLQTEEDLGALNMPRRMPFPS